MSETQLRPQPINEAGSPPDWALPVVYQNVEPQELEVADLKFIDTLTQPDDETHERTPQELRAVDLGAAIIHASGPYWYRDTEHTSDSTWWKKTNQPEPKALPTMQSDEWYR